MWQSRTKTELVIEVWEKLDCENVGRAEIEAIETVVSDQLGRGAVDPPMVIARMLADEGADLRHSEIMELHVERTSDRPYDAALRNIFDLSSIKAGAGSIRRLENLRRKYLAEEDRDGLRMLMETARRARKSAQQRAAKPNGGHYSECAEWLRIWLENPDVFEPWFSIRVNSPDFKAKFGVLDQQ